MACRVLTDQSPASTAPDPQHLPGQVPTPAGRLPLGRGAPGGSHAAPGAGAGSGRRLIAEVPARLGPATRLGALAGELLGDEAAQALQILAVELDVVVPGALHPQRLHGLGAALVEGQPVREVDHLVLRAVDDEHRRRDLGHLLDVGERVKAVGLLGVGEGDTHARGERRVQHHSGALVARGQVHRGHRADALPVQNYAVRADAVPGAQGLPGSVNVSVQILLGGFAGAHAVTRVVVREDVAVDACA